MIKFPNDVSKKGGGGSIPSKFLHLIFLSSLILIVWNLGNIFM